MAQRALINGSVPRRVFLLAVLAGVFVGGSLASVTAAPASSPPSEIVTEPAEATPNGFNLEGRLNPGGLPTTYYFEYSRASTICDEGCVPQRTAVAGPLTGDVQQAVGPVELTGLIAGETYWYRLVASNADGADEGGFVNFTAAPPPSLEGESVSHVTQSDATLEAEIRAEGLEYGAYYQFQLVANPNEYAAKLVCPSYELICSGVGPRALPIGWIAGGSSGQLVTLDLAGADRALQPDTTYHYRVIAAKTKLSEDTTSWESPTVYGSDQTFTTPPAQSSPPAQGSQGSSPPVAGEEAHAAATETELVTPLIATPPVETTAIEPKQLTKAQKLASALKACEGKRKRRRTVCEKRARRKYGVAIKKTGKPTAKGKR